MIKRVGVVLEFVTSLSGRTLSWIFAGCLIVMISGCSPSFHDLGIPPVLTPPGNSIRPNRLQPITAPKPMKISQRYTMANNSFWDAKGGIYFRDSRAYEVGDILTVRIVMNESAKFKNKSDRESTASGAISSGSDFSFGQKVSPTLALDTSGNLTTKLERGGNINRSEALKLSIAAVVIEAAPNGNLFVHGTQEVRVNHEIRVLTVQGFVRSRDILPDNTIAYDKIAEARISYGGDNTRKREKLFFNPHHRSSRRSATRWMRN